MTGKGRPRRAVARFLAAAAGLLAVGLGVASLIRPPAPPTEVRGGRTNVLLLILDTVRADHLTPYGYGVDTTPGLARLAGDGVRFARFLSNSPWTRPGVATLLTGLYPRSTGIHEEKFDALAPDLTMLAERLQARGYLTLGVTANPNVNAWFGFDQGFAEYGDCGVVWRWMPRDHGEKAYKRGKVHMETATSLTDRALAAVDHHRDAGRGRPFYLQALYIDPHWPYEPPEEHLRAVRDAGSRHAAYDGELRYMDAEVTRLLAGLEDRGLLRDTLIVVTSDHGEGLEDHPSVPLSQTHGSILYDSVLHVPLILHHPTLPRGRVVDDMAASIDLVPTVLDLLGWPAPPGELPGHSLAPLVRGGGPVPGLPDRVFAETDWRMNRKVAVRTASHKYIRNDDCRLYQAEGIHEERELNRAETRMLTEVPIEELYRVDDGKAEDPRRTDVLEAEAAAVPPLAESLRAWEASTPRRPSSNHDPEDGVTTPSGFVPEVPAGDPAARKALDPEVTAQLRALGYLDDGDGEGTGPASPSP